ncbi:MAG: hypothetical protein WBO82_05835 [Neisseria sp.]
MKLPDDTAENIVAAMVRGHKAAPEGSKDSAGMVSAVAAMGGAVVAITAKELAGHLDMIEDLQDRVGILEVLIEELRVGVFTK